MQLLLRVLNLILLVGLATGQMGLLEVDLCMPDAPGAGASSSWTSAASGCTSMGEMNTLSNNNPSNASRTQTFTITAADVGGMAEADELMLTFFRSKPTGLTSIKLNITDSTGASMLQNGTTWLQQSYSLAAVAHTRAAPRAVYFTRFFFQQRFFSFFRAGSHFRQLATFTRQASRALSFAGHTFSKLAAKTQLALDEARRLDSGDDASPGERRLADSRRRASSFSDSRRRAPAAFSDGRRRAPAFFARYFSRSPSSFFVRSATQTSRYGTFTPTRTSTGYRGPASMSSISKKKVAGAVVVAGAAALYLNSNGGIGRRRRARAYTSTPYYAYGRAYRSAKCYGSSCTNNQLWGTDSCGTTCTTSSTCCPRQGGGIAVGSGIAFDSALVVRDDLLQTRFKVAAFSANLPWTISLQVETPTQNVGLTSPTQTALLRPEMYISLSDAKAKPKPTDGDGGSVVGSVIGAIAGLAFFGGIFYVIYKKCCGGSKQVVVAQQQQQQQQPQVMMVMMPPQQQQQQQQQPMMGQPMNSNQPQMQQQMMQQQMMQQQQQMMQQQQMQQQPMMGQPMNSNQPQMLMQPQMQQQQMMQQPGQAMMMQQGQPMMMQNGQPMMQQQPAMVVAVGQPVMKQM
jgi:hypothetical protein